jgi:hypothetical protein
LPILISVAMAVLPSPTWIKNLATDDALYYPTVARNIVNGLGSSYDGITLTNGYHPLWCWLELPIAFATSSLNQMTYLWIVKLLMVVLVGLCVVVWEKVVFRITGSTWMSSTFVVLIGAYWWSVHVLYSGMETPLVVLMMGVSLLMAHRLIDNRSTGTAVALGAAMAFTLLARLDSVFFLGVLGLVVLLKLKANIRLQLTWIVPMVLIPIPYLLWNLRVFGNLVPVSGIRKSVEAPSITDQLGIIGRFFSEKWSKVYSVLGPAGAALMLAFVVVGLVIVWIGRRELSRHAKSLSILWTVPVGAVMHFFYVATFMVEINVSWYQYAEYLTVFLFVSVVVAAAVSWLQARPIAEKRPQIAWAPFAAVYALIVATLLAFAPAAMPDVMNVRSYDAAMWSRQHLDAPNVRFGMYDPGVFRFVSGYPTVALNGLASTRDVTELVNQQKWSEIIRRYKINYVIQFVANEAMPSIPQQYIKHVSEPFEKYAWRYNGYKTGRLVIMDASYPGIDSLI